MPRKGEILSAVVLHSGGLDSTTALYWALQEGYIVHPLSANYGQRHERELGHAMSISSQLFDAHPGCRPATVADLRGISHLLQGSALTTSTVEVPDGHYTAPSMKATVVPNRNMILLAVAAGYAISKQASVVIYAAHAGDHTIYPDCRPAFVGAMQQALACCDWTHVALVAPFIEKTKADIVRLGAELGVPFERTWSCYRGNNGGHCGTCGTCVERREAFQRAGIPDPTRYEAA
jgi:7-cyano-7-deazaguanine synthase